MNAFIKKEIRLLLPTFLIGCALAFSNLGFRFQSDGSLTNAWVFMLAFVFSGAVAIMLALNSFGAEFSSGTFANLLAQPISRQKIWDTKIALLAGSLFIIAVCWSGCGILRLFLLGRELNLLDLFSGIITFGLVVFSGGLWTVLLFRQVAAAFWFTILAPGVVLVIVAVINAMTNIQDANFFTGLIVTCLGIYSLAGFFFARWLFFRAQDVQWSGGNIVMPEMRGLSAWLSKTSSLRVFRPRAALIRKEIQLHQSQFVMAFVVLVLHLGVLATRSLLDLTKSPDLKFLLESFWGLWLAMPLLVGCAAVAEERKIGTLEGQLCLPVMRRTQFAVKLVVAIGLSLMFGTVIPLLLEGPRILPDTHFPISVGAGWVDTMTPLQANIFSALGIFLADLPLWSFIFLTLVICFVSFYVSTLARNTLQTLAPAVVGIMAAVALVLGSFMPWNYVWEWLWQGPVGFIIGLPIIALAVLLMMFKNFQILRPDWRTGMRNLGVFALALLLSVFAASSVYHRFWEKFSALEPAHGAARLDLSTPAWLDTQRNSWFVRLPDGQVWQSKWKQNQANQNPVAQLLGNFQASIAPGKFLGASNWLSVQCSRWDIVGLKTDGTLWVSEKPLPSKRLADGRRQNESDGLNRLIQFGVETNWTSLMSFFNIALLTKNDGTLWRLGDMAFDDSHQEWPGLRNFTPQRVGGESNWTQVWRAGYQHIFYKNDGSVWMAGAWDTNHLAKLELVSGWELYSVPSLQQHGFRSQTIISYGGSYLAGIANDGTFRIFADEHIRFDSQKRNGQYYFSPTNLLIGTGSNWLSVAGGWQKVITLKKDGTLWLWDFGRPWNFRNSDEEIFTSDVQHTVPVRLGTHSDWISISGNDMEVVALAADGSLWFWPLSGAEYFPISDEVGSPHNSPVLDISRKPQLLGNIFSKTE
jgi:ABC-type transport system involved in multi-copper enzyme maturation permease subunit